MALWPSLPLLKVFHQPRLLPLYLSGFKSNAISPVKPSFNFSPPPHIHIPFTELRATAALLSFISLCFALWLFACIDSEIFESRDHVFLVSLSSLWSLLKTVACSSFHWKFNDWRTWHNPQFTFLCDSDRRGVWGADSYNWWWQDDLMCFKHMQFCFPIDYDYALLSRIGKGWFDFE